MEILTKKLRELSSIQPRSDFHARSRQLVTGMPQCKKTFLSHISESFYYSLALGLGALLLVTGLGRFSYLHFNDLSPVVVGSLQTKTLVTEDAQIDFNLQIAEATYFEETAGVVAVALRVVRDTNPDHLNEAVLEQELRILDDAKPSTIENL